MPNPIFTSDLVVKDKQTKNIRIEAITVTLTYKDFMIGSAEGMSKIIREDLKHVGKLYDQHSDVHYYYHDPRYLKQLPKYQITAHLMHDKAIETDHPDAHSEVHLVFYRDHVDNSVVEMVSEALSVLVWHDIAVDQIVDIDML